MDLFAHIVVVPKLAPRNLEHIDVTNVSAVFQLLLAPSSIKPEYHLPLGMRQCGYLPLQRMEFQRHRFISYYRLIRTGQFG